MIIDDETLLALGIQSTKNSKELNSFMRDILDKNNNLLKEKSELDFEIDRLKREIERLNKENELLKSNPNFVYAMRNNKAIEYLKNNIDYPNIDLFIDDYVIDLLNILQGGDKE